MSKLTTQFETAAGRYEGEDKGGESDVVRTITVHCPNFFSSQSTTYPASECVDLEFADFTTVYMLTTGEGKSVELFVDDAPADVTYRARLARGLINHSAMTDDDVAFFKSNSSSSSSTA